MNEQEQLRFRGLAASYRYNAHDEQQLAIIQMEGKAGWLKLSPLDRLTLAHYYEARAAQLRIAEAMANQSGREK